MCRGSDRGNKLLLNKAITKCKQCMRAMLQFILRSCNVDDGPHFQTSVHICTSKVYTGKQETLNKPGACRSQQTENSHSWTLSTYFCPIKPIIATIWPSYRALHSDFYSVCRVNTQIIYAIWPLAVSSALTVGCCTVCCGSERHLHMFWSTSQTLTRSPNSHRGPEAAGWISRCNGPWSTTKIWTKRQKERSRSPDKWHWHLKPFQNFWGFLISESSTVQLLHRKH